MLLKTLNRVAGRSNVKELRRTRFRPNHDWDELLRGVGENLHRISPQKL
jgi:hypothetical protein